MKTPTKFPALLTCAAIATLSTGCSSPSSYGSRNYNRREDSHYRSVPAQRTQYVEAAPQPDEIEKPKDDDSWVGPAVVLGGLAALAWAFSGGDSSSSSSSSNATSSGTSQADLDAWTATNHQQKQENRQAYEQGKPEPHYGVGR